LLFIFLMGSAKMFLNQVTVAQVKNLESRNKSQFQNVLRSMINDFFFLANQVRLSRYLMQFILMTQKD
jgi:hypothetical protein